MPLEFNVRFGDPETQVLMLTMDGDLGDALDAAARGVLDNAELTPNHQHALCVVLAAHGYPEKPRAGDRITGLDAAAAPRGGVRVLHAGTVAREDGIFTAGGRVLGVAAHAMSLDEASRRAYAAIQHIQFEGMQFRRDIGRRAFGGKPV